MESIHVKTEHQRIRLIAIIFVVVKDWFSFNVVN